MSVDLWRRQLESGLRQFVRERIASGLVAGAPGATPRLTEASTSSWRRRNPVHRVPEHRPVAQHAMPSRSRTRPSDNASHSGAFRNTGKRLAKPLRRVREHLSVTRHAGRSR